MHSVYLPNCARPVPRLGFGGASLVGGPARKHSLQLLETAFACGIRHFDVAPSYGLGSAEEVLGEFAARHRGEITITTKFGSARPASAQRIFLQWTRAALRPIVNRLPAVKERLLAELSRQASVAPKFEAGQLLLSLEKSLRSLRSEQIELFLLHEVDNDGLRDDLILALERAQQEGKIGAWGIGSERQKIEQIPVDQLARVRVLQFESSLMTSHHPEYPDTFVITHKAIASAFTTLNSVLADADVCRRWSQTTGLDLADRRELARAIIASALVLNSNGIVLFWSSNMSRIEANALALDVRYQGPGQQLLHLIEQACSSSNRRMLQPS